MKTSTQEKTSRKKRLSMRQRQLLTGGFSSLLLIVSILYAGMRIERSRYEKPLPSNEQCRASNAAVKEALKVFQAQILAALDGKDAPAPDLSPVKNASVECNKNINNYQVIVSK